MSESGGYVAACYCFLVVGAESCPIDIQKVVYTFIGKTRSHLVKVWKFALLGQIQPKVGNRLMRQV